MKYEMFSDPSHGWLKVERAELARLGIADKISSYSYQHGSSAYLEEDCDAGCFLVAKEKVGETVEINEHFSNGSSPIRNYNSYRP